MNGTKARTNPNKQHREISFAFRIHDIVVLKAWAGIVKPDLCQPFSIVLQAAEIDEGNAAVMYWCRPICKVHRWSLDKSDEVIYLATRGRQTSNGMIEFYEHELCQAPPEVRKAWFETD